jgi:hypothetical protein
VRRAALLALFLLAGCDRTTHVAGPFYLRDIDIDEGMMLYRCPQGPGKHCVRDRLPGPTAFAAGGDDRYVVVARHPGSTGANDKTVTQYFYFRRVPQEAAKWWLNPEKIVGPLTPQEFNAAKAALHLPAFSVTLDDLK